MTQWNVTDEQTAKELENRGYRATIHVDGESWYERGSVAMGPARETGKVLVLTATRKQVEAPAATIQKVSVPEEEPSTEPKEKRNYVATGFLGLDELVEEEPEVARPWWKRIFLD